MNRRFHPQILVLILLALAMTSCSKSTPVRTKQNWLKTELYFGLSRISQPNITEAQWQAFVDQEITPRFPQGFTVISARGQWQNIQKTIIQENSKVLVIIHADTAVNDVNIEQIRHIFCKQFHQELVLRATIPIKTDLK